MAYRDSLNMNVNFFNALVKLEGKNLHIICFKL